MPIRRGYAVLLLIFVALGIYYPSIFGNASSVDDAQVITAFLNIDHFDLKSIFFPGNNGYYYRPLLVMTLIFDSMVWGMHESFMHLDNVILHVINVILVYYVSVFVARSYSFEENIFPCCAALLFAVHPINTESVNWISGRTDLLAGMFLLISILLLLCALQRYSPLAALGAAVSLLFSCFAKEVTVFAIPGIIYLILFHDGQGSLLDKLRKTWIYSTLMSLAVLTYFLFRSFAFKVGDSGIKSVGAIASAPASESYNLIRITLKAYGFYLKKIFFPWPLNFAIVKISDAYLIAGILFFFIIIYLLYRHNLVSSLYLISICVLSPALFVALGRMAWTPLAERYLYVPCTTFSIALALGGCRSLSNVCVRYRTASYLIIVLVLISSIYSTVNRNIIWQNNVDLYQDTLRKSPDFFLVQNALAFALADQGKRVEAKQILSSMVAPEGNKRGGKLIDSNRARILVTEGNLEGARKLLLRDMEESGVFYTNIAEQIIGIDMQILQKQCSKRKVQELRDEVVKYLLKLQEKNADPLYYYRIGQFYLHCGDKVNAKRYFLEASIHSPDGAYYKQAATKLVEKLKP